MRIWKWKLRITDEQIVDLPIAAMILTAQMQEGELCLWALCSEDAPKEERRIRIYGTGHEIQRHSSMKYISTFQIPEAGLVFHVFEVT